MPERTYLNHLKPGEKGAVEDIFLEENIKRRLQDIGLIKGTIVECVYTSPLGDPVAYLIKGAVIAIRSEESEKIVIIHEAGGANGVK